jgi:N-acetyltransferase
MQRTAVNSEAKLLGLGHAFETLGLRRVEFKTDVLNEQSRAGILGIGAQFEGIFRKHMVMTGGRARDSAYYSVIDTEWPDVRAHLQGRLARHTSEEGSR